MDIKKQNMSQQSHSCTLKRTNLPRPSVAVRNGGRCVCLVVTRRRRKRRGEDTAKKGLTASASAQHKRSLELLVLTQTHTPLIASI